MTEEAANLMLELLRALRSDVAAHRAETRDGFAELRSRLGHVETELARVHGVLAEQSVRLDRVIA